MAPRLPFNAASDDAAARLVYADWLEERGDIRGEYLRLATNLIELPAGHETVPILRQRLAELRAELSPDWLELLGDFCSVGSGPDPKRTELVAGALGRPVHFVAADGYVNEIVAAVPHRLSDLLAYVECRSRWVRPDYLDINYHLRIRGDGGRERAWPIETYNPYFGCNVRFLEWCGETALVIYDEKHKTYACRFGLATGATFRTINYRWVLDGRHLAYWNYQEPVVRRVSIPGLETLPSLTADEANRWGLVPVDVG